MDLFWPKRFHRNGNKCHWIKNCHTKECHKSQETSIKIKWISLKQVMLKYFKISKESKELKLMKHEREK
jgi:hypothetical protein